MQQNVNPITNDSFASSIQNMTVSCKGVIAYMQIRRRVLKLHQVDNISTHTGIFDAEICNWKRQQ